MDKNNFIPDIAYVDDNNQYETKDEFIENKLAANAFAAHINLRTDQAPGVHVSSCPLVL